METQEEPLDPVGTVEPVKPADPDEPVARPGRISRAVRWSVTKAGDVTAWALGARETHPSVDVGFRYADRDKRVAAGVLAGGIAYRFFFWLLSASVVTSGALGFSTSAHVSTALNDEGVSQVLSKSVSDAAAESHTARWWLLIVGIWLVLWTGYNGAKALVMVHATVWAVPPPSIKNPLRASLTFSGVVTTFIVSMGVVAWLRTQSPGLGLTATLAFFLVPFSIWLFVSRALPHDGAGWLPLLPGAIVVGVGVQALHVFTALFLGLKLESATARYGLVGIVATLLFWLYLVGRLIIGGATLNASLSERQSIRLEENPE